MPSASLFFVCSIIGPFDKAKLQMFSPLFTKVTVAENEMEVTAPGLPCLASSNAVLERLLLEKLNCRSSEGWHYWGALQFRLARRQEWEPWRAATTSLPWTTVSLSRYAVRWAVQYVFLDLPPIWRLGHVTPSQSYRPLLVWAKPATLVLCQH